MGTAMSGTPGGKPHSLSGALWAASALTLLVPAGALAGDSRPAMSRLLELAAWEPAPAPPVSRTLQPLGDVPVSFSCLFDGRTGEPVSSRVAMERLLASRIVHVGEKHDERLHHEAQRFLLEALRAAGPGTAGAFEMLHSSHQEALDRYLAGGSEEAFLAEVDWPKTWGFPFELYRPLFSSLRDNGLPGLALNVPKAVVHKVSREGPGSLSPEERRFVPSDMRRTQDATYLAMLRETFLQHGGEAADEAAFGRYLDAMTLWNEGMAARAAAYAASRPGSRLLVFAGMFHAYDAGIPEGVRRRLPGVRQTGVVLAEADACPASLPSGSLALASDLVWVLAGSPRF